MIWIFTASEQDDKSTLPSHQQNRNSFPEPNLSGVLHLRRVVKIEGSEVYGSMSLLFHHDFER